MLGKKRELKVAGTFKGMNAFLEEKNLHTPFTKKYLHHLDERERRVTLSIIKLAQKQGRLKQGIASAAGSSFSGPNYERIRAMETILGNLLYIQRVAGLYKIEIVPPPKKPDSQTHISYFPAIIGPSPEERAKLKLMREIDESIKGYESTPLGFSEKLKAQWNKVRPSRRIDWRHPISTWKGMPMHVTSEPRDFADYVLKRIQGLKRKEKRVTIVLGV